LIDEPENQFMFWLGSPTPMTVQEIPTSHWLTAQGNYSDGAVLTVYETLGGKFDDPQAVGATVVGSLD
jgi:hypothetical protein